MDVDDTLKDALLRSLQQVGPAKPVGYLPLSTVSDVLGLEVDDLIRDAIRGAYPIFSTFLIIFCNEYGKTLIYSRGTSGFSM
jgi:hypothetical protein